MRWIGTSGYSYAEWKGSFYPEKMPQAKMFAFYAERFPTVEINNTFYRMPDDKLLDGWSSAAPKTFRFTLKAPQRITHIARLKNAEELVRVFVTRARRLGDQLGVLFFQLAPNFKADPILLGDFLALFRSVDADARLAFEFRNKGWFTDETFEKLSAHRAALCIADSEKLSTPVTVTADYGYFRLRDEGYRPEDIARWAATIREHEPKWKDVYVYFKHEEAGLGPAFAKKLTDLLDAAP
jgi:uncharacterized protein YecE (DUF72 family)